MYDAPLRALITSILSVLEEGGYEVFSTDRAEAFGLDEKLSSHEIAMRDFDWMKRCESFVAVLPAGRNGVLRTDGTHVELGWASALGKPIVAVAPPFLPASYGHLVRGLDSIARDFVDIGKVQRHPAVLREVVERRSRANSAKYLESPQRSVGSVRSLPAKDTLRSGLLQSLPTALDHTKRQAPVWRRS